MYVYAPLTTSAATGDLLLTNPFKAVAAAVIPRLPIKRGKMLLPNSFSYYMSDHLPTSEQTLGVPQRQYLLATPPRLVACCRPAVR